MGNNRACVMTGVVNGREGFLKQSTGCLLTVGASYMGLQ